ncbi:MAG: hypothetical protein NVS3B25_01610 [Hymenobacter sp.]
MITKSAYQRPYKTRHERRDYDRRRHDEANDYKFLWRVVGIVGVLFAVALGFAIKGATDRDSGAGRTTMLGR